MNWPFWVHVPVFLYYLVPLWLRLAILFGLGVWAGAALA